MKLIEADKVKRAMKDYWKAQVDKALTLTFIDGNEANKRINSYLEHNHELLKAIDELPSAQSDTTSGDYISRQEALNLFPDDNLYWDTNEGYFAPHYAKTLLRNLPSAQPEHMHTVMLKIAEKYEKAMNTSCILNPMAWALYQTWKEYDR